MATFYFTKRIVFICCLLPGLLLAKAEPLKVQKRSVLIQDGYFYPEKIILFQGEKLHLIVGNFMGHSTCLSNEKLKFFINSSPGNIVESDLEFKGPGNFEFSCPGLRSNLSVEVKESPVLLDEGSNRYRAPASVITDEWVPRNIEFDKQEVY